MAPSRPQHAIHPSVASKRPAFIRLNALMAIPRTPTLTVTIAVSFCAFVFMTFTTDFRALTMQNSTLYLASVHARSGERSAPIIHRNVDDCLRFVLYDKPVKTGSSATAAAIRRYFAHRGELDYPCSLETCLQSALEICNGSIPRRHLLGHLIPDAYTTSCMRRMGYYFVTSIRAPPQRWKSMFKYNRQLKTEHYGIPHTSSYAYFMNHVPECALYDYYDRKGEHCGEASELQERIDGIVARFDEVIDLYEEPHTDLHKRVASLLVTENVSEEPPEEDGADVNETRMANEWKLFRALKQKSMLVPDPGRTLCGDLA